MIIYAKKEKTKGKTGFCPRHIPRAPAASIPRVSVCRPSRKEAISRNSAAAGVPGSESDCSCATVAPYALPGDPGAVAILLEKPVGPVFSVRMVDRYGNRPRIC